MPILAVVRSESIWAQGLSGKQALMNVQVEPFACDDSAQEDGPQVSTAPCSLCDAGVQRRRQGPCLVVSQRSCSSAS